MNKAYAILMALFLTSLGIKYEGTNNNPFRHPSPTTLLFLTAASCHVLASNAEPQLNLPTTIFIFHASGIVACESLMWIILGDILWWYIINVLLLLVASFCFNNYRDIIARIRGTPHSQNLEEQEAQI